MKYYALLFSALVFLCFPGQSAFAGNFDDVFEQHDQCYESCEETRDQALEMLECDYYGTQSAFSSCQRRAVAARSACNSQCNSAQGAAISACRDTYREEKKECRQDKREESKECREAKKAERKSCRQNKIDEKEACKSLSGKAKRECKKEARQAKRECKKQMRQTKRACKKDARVDKRECKDTVKAERDTCIAQAERQGRQCRDRCADTFAASCVEQRQAANACEVQARPAFDSERLCKEICDEDKEAGLQGYNPACTNDRAGDKGATITFYNASGADRHYYRAEPYPEETPTSPLTRTMTFKETLAPGESYEQEIPCGIALLFHFKDRKTDGSDFVGQQFTLGPFPCCEEAIEQTIPVNP
jgi:hypothetical protein